MPCLHRADCHLLIVGREDIEILDNEQIDQNGDDLETEEEKDAAQPGDDSSPGSPAALSGQW